MKKVRATRGQSVVEFAIILPVFLALVGATADVARVYSTWIGVHAAARDPAARLRQIHDLLASGSRLEMVR